MNQSTQTKKKVPSKNSPLKMAKNGRNTKGQFTKGHSIATGRPPREFNIPDILREQGHKIADKKKKRTYYEMMCQIAWEQAIQGDRDARKWITDRVEGQAPQSIKMQIDDKRPTFTGTNPNKFLNEYIHFQNAEA